MLNTESRLALPCGHVFHQECIQRYAGGKNCLLEFACVYRCMQPSQPETPERLLSQGSPQADVPPQSDAGGAAELVDSDIEVLINGVEEDAQQFAG